MKSRTASTLLRFSINANFVSRPRGAAAGRQRHARRVRVKRQGYIHLRFVKVPPQMTGGLRAP
eukprot:6554543-Prymnesium_polylepis.1